MPLKKEDAKGMTINERLYAAGLPAAFDDALEHRDEAGLREILSAVYLEDAEIESVLARMLSPGWAVIVETAKRFRASDWVEATRVIQGIDAPIDVAERETEHARVQMAIIKLSEGDVVALRLAANLATLDWQKALVAAGLADSDWQQTLTAEGYNVPGGRVKSSWPLRPLK